MQHDSLNVAMACYRRRGQLWKAARAACPDVDSFRANTGAIERAISALLAEEFPAT